MNLADGMQKATPNGRSVAIALYCVVFLVNGMRWYGYVIGMYWLLVSLLRICYNGLFCMLNRFEACVGKRLKMFQIGIHLPSTAAGMAAFESKGLL